MLQNLYYIIQSRLDDASDMTFMIIYTDFLMLLKVVIHVFTQYIYFLDVF